MIYVRRFLLHLRRPSQARPGPIVLSLAETAMRSKVNPDARSNYIYVRGDHPRQGQGQ